MIPNIALIIAIVALAITAIIAIGLIEKIWILYYRIFIYENP
jgi:hypothetical protein